MRSCIVEHFTTIRGRFRYATNVRETADWLFLAAMERSAVIHLTPSEIFRDPSQLPPYPYEKIGGVTCEVLRASGKTRGNVVLLHGILGGSEGVRSFMSPFAAHGFNVFALNYPHHGPDYCPQKIAGVRAMDCVNAAHTVLAEVGDAVVVGKSFGGLVAQAIAHEPQVKATILLASSPPPGVKFKADPLLVARLTPVILELLFRKTFIYRYGFCRRYVYNRAANEAQARQWHETMTRESVWLVWDQIRYRVPVFPRETNAPMLVTVGSNDPGLPPEVQQETARLWKADYHEFPGHSHMLTEETGWEQVFLTVMRWIDRKLISATEPKTDGEMQPLSATASATVHSPLG